MSPGRIRDPEGAKTIVVSFNTTAGAITTIVKRRFLITCCTETDTCRLKLNSALTAGDTGGAKKGAKKILIYDSCMHPLSSSDPSKCGPGVTPRERLTWAINTLKLLEQIPSIAVPEGTSYNDEDMGIADEHAPIPQQQPCPREAEALDLMSDLW